MTCDPQTLVDEAKCIFECVPQGMQLPVLIATLCQILAQGGIGQVFADNYGGNPPTFTPTATAAIAFDTSNAGHQYNWWGGAWH